MPVNVLTTQLFVYVFMCTLQQLQYTKVHEEAEEGRQNA